MRILFSSGVIKDRTHVWSEAMESKAWMRLYRVPDLFAAVQQQGDEMPVAPPPPPERPTSVGDNGSSMLAERPSAAAPAPSASDHTPDAGAPSTAPTLASVPPNPGTEDDASYPEISPETIASERSVRHSTVAVTSAPLPVPPPPREALYHHFTGPAAVAAAAAAAAEKSKSETKSRGSIKSWFGTRRNSSTKRGLLTRMQRPSPAVARPVSVLSSTHATAVFGVPLESLPLSAEGVPEILCALRQLLFDRNGHVAEGIFRVSASYGALQTARQNVEAGTLSKIPDVECIAHLLKLWFRAQSLRLAVAHAAAPPRL